MPQYKFNAVLSTEQCLGYYRGEIKYVLVTTDEGLRIQLHFRHLQPFVDALGLRGRFRLSVTEQGSFQRLEKIN
ncbi:DUF2835 domain-containing protein [Rheinheimera muenzenbergensis]|uniref:DUF2835 domain-containing protein n=1 Tax=Rheinheimera muenzenbergensis TaxID=1193628 RepID=A0ABU8CC07_9GAMM